MNPPAEPLAIRAREIRKCFGSRRALDGVSFDLKAGEVLGYVGPNGAGKTTTLRILTGTESDFKGELDVLGKSMPAQRNALYAQIGYLPQSVAFAPWRTAEETLWLLGRLSGVDEPRLRRRVPEALERVGLARDSATRLGEFSGGMKQRLGLAQAVLHQSRLLVLDEPFNHLDPTGRVDLKKLLLEVSQGGAAILFSSHILTDVEELVHRLVVLHQGKVHFTGTPGELRRSEAGVETVEIVTNLAADHAQSLRDIVGVAAVTVVEGGPWKLQFAPGADAEAATTRALNRILAAGGTIRSVIPFEPTLEEIIARLGRQAAP